MLDIDEINKEIEKLENCNCTTHSACQKLASLYIVRDHFKGGWEEKKTSTVDAMIKSNTAMQPTSVKEL